MSDNAHCPRCKLPRTPWLLHGIKDPSTDVYRLALKASGDCCNPKCRGIWGTGCWHCHHPRFAGGGRGLNLYLVKTLDPVGWDDYDAAVIRAPNEPIAGSMHPGGYDNLPLPENWRHLEIALLAQDVAGETGVILGSFNAG